MYLLWHGLVLAVKTFSVYTKCMAKMGRPPKTEEERQTRTLRVRLTSADDQTIRQAAEAAGKSLSAWVRDVLVRAAKRRLNRR